MSALRGRLTAMSRRTNLTSKSKRQNRLPIGSRANSGDAGSICLVSSLLEPSSAVNLI